MSTTNRCIAFLLLLSGLLTDAAAQEEVVVDPVAVEQAVERGLTWLRAQQQEDGGWGGPEEPRVALTALALLTQFAAGGRPVAVDEAGRARQRALDWLLGQSDGTGYFGASHGGRMYAHALASLAVSQALGMTGSSELDERCLTALRAAVGRIEAAARVEKPAPHRGGWRYQPDQRQSDLSVTGWQLQALQAARSCGLSVDRPVLEEAGAYVLNLIGPDGSVGYQQPEEDRPSLRGVALLALTASGLQAPGPRLAVLRQLEADPIDWRGPWFFYRCYHEAVALSASHPESWQAYRRILLPLLLEQQDQAGWWPQPPGDNEGEHGRVYAACLALMALTAERHALPAHVSW